MLTGPEVLILCAILAALYMWDWWRRNWKGEKPVNRFTNWARRRLLRVVVWVERKMHAHPDYDRQDPEWIAMQNEATSLKRDLKQQIEKPHCTK